MRLIHDQHPGAIELAAIRAKLTERQAALKALDNPMRTSEEATAKFLEWAKQARELAETNLSYSARHSIEFNLDELQTNPIGVAALFFGTDFDKRVHKIFESICGKSGITSETRTAAMSELKATIRAIEQDEERAIMTLEDAGWSIPRRRNIDPALIWELWCQ